MLRRLIWPNAPGEAPALSDQRLEQGVQAHGIYGCPCQRRAVLNDSYRTDVCLLHPPQTIAVACMHVASVLVRRCLRAWLQSVACDLDEVLQISLVLLQAYKEHRSVVTAETCNRYLQFLQ